MGKKVYITPNIEVIDVESIEMMAASAPQIDIIKPGEEGSTGTDILSNGRRGKWGDLWSKDGE